LLVRLFQKLLYCNYGLLSEVSLMMMMMTTPCSLLFP